MTAGASGPPDDPSTDPSTDPSDDPSTAPLTAPSADAASPFRSVGPALLAVGLRPDLWVTAARQILVLAPSGWWRHRPYLPLPDRAYLRFRMVTQYGDPDHQPESRDLVTYLHWCRAERRSR